MPRARSRSSASAVDVAIVGAGVAGLAAASHLAEAGHEIAVLEARDRIGGRILTERPDDLSAPVELGAEFIHGEAPRLREIADRHRLSVLHIADRRFQRSGARLRERCDYWERLDRVIRRLKSDRTPDRALAATLDGLRPGLRSSERRLMTQFVEGFYLADPNDVSERWLADAGAPCDDIREIRMARLAGGYGQLVETLAGPVRGHILTGAIVSAIRWRRGSVEIESHDVAGRPYARVIARAVIVTVPLGVLAATPGGTGALRLDPPIPALDRAVALGRMGLVAKVALRFREPFWLNQAFGKHRRQPSLDAMSFLESPSLAPFSICWTTAPIRSPLLVAWAGGPSVARLPLHSKKDLTQLAIASVSTALAMDEAAVRQEYVGSFYHDWSNDPFARGGYSYARVGGHRLAERLARSTQDTIWVAGEAVDREGRTGTVHGAMASGQRAARQVVEASLTHG